ncbi:ubiquitin carboxyl-terminal hydrolase 25-like isoform X8 [Equus caballus]|uniref:ubiquitin carboxyl-terminal hydrolase 25-like isoform X8 n=1 Tax=Equus caballus TaxID=9796 RepID=UPI0038B3BB24
MTVEQNVLQQSAAQKHQQTFLNQLREITGINDAQILQQALKDSNGNLELAVAFLTAKNAKTPQQEETTYYQTALPGSDRYISVGSQADARRIPQHGVPSGAMSAPGIQTRKPWAAEAERANLTTAPPGQPLFIMFTNFFILFAV